MSERKLRQLSLVLHLSKKKYNIDIKYFTNFEEKNVLFVVKWDRCNINYIWLTGTWSVCHTSTFVILQTLQQSFMQGTTQTCTFTIKLLICFNLLKCVSIDENIYSFPNIQHLKVWRIEAMIKCCNTDYKTLFLKHNL